MATMNWRTINVDLLDPESPANFDISSLLPTVSSVSASEVQTLSSQIKQLLRGGDSEGALRGALENAPYGGDAQAKVSNTPTSRGKRKLRSVQSAQTTETIELTAGTGYTSSNSGGNSAINQAV